MLSTLILACLPLQDARFENPDPGRHDLVWTTPSADASGSMPLGNGEVAVNAWVEPSGDLCFYLARTDAWSENGRLLKVGKVRVAFDPPFVPDLTLEDGFEQRLSLKSGKMFVRMRREGVEASMQLFVDAESPIVIVRVDSDPYRTATLTIEPWRT